MKPSGGLGEAFCHRERWLENFCNKLLKWRYQPIVSGSDVLLINVRFQGVERKSDVRFFGKPKMMSESPQYYGHLE